jgi:hypothetical protein
VNTKTTRVATLLLIAIIWLLGAPVAHATEFASGNQAFVSSDQTIEDDLFISGRTVEIQGNVNGDVYAAVADVNIVGPAQDDVVVAGANVDLSGAIRDDLRAEGVA